MFYYKTNDDPVLYCQRFEIIHIMRHWDPQFKSRMGPRALEILSSMFLFIEIIKMRSPVG